MLSLFYKNSEITLTKNTKATIFKPNKDTQVLLLKGKLGQFLLTWPITKKLTNLRIFEKKTEKNAHKDPCSSERMNKNLSMVGQARKKSNLTFFLSPI